MVISRSGGKLASSTKEDGQHEPEQINNHSGMGEGTNRIDVGGGGEEDKLVDIDRVIDKYRLNTGIRNARKTQNDYSGKFRIFMATVPNITRRELSSTKGRMALVNFLSDKTAAYRAGIKKVWTKGLCLPWPITKDDISRAKKVRPSVAPPTTDVLAFDAAMMKVSDDRKRLSWMMISQLGWSPADVVVTISNEIKEWNGIFYIERERQKTGSLIVAVIGPELKALIDKVGKFDVKADCLWNWWKSVTTRYKVKSLTPRQVRKWVKVRAREAGLSQPSTSMMMGHDTDSMAGWYDKPPLEEILVEQSSMMPHGVLGLVKAPKVELVTEDNEAMAIWHDFKEGKFGTMEMASKLETLRQRILLPTFGK